MKKKPVEKDERTILIELQCIKTAVIVTAIFLVGSIIFITIKTRSFHDVILPTFIIAVFWFTFSILYNSKRPEVIPTAFGIIDLPKYSLLQRLGIYFIEAIFVKTIWLVMDYFFFQVLLIFPDLAASKTPLLLSTFIVECVFLFIILWIIHERSLRKYRENIIETEESSQ